MIAGIAAAVIIAVILFILIGNVLGWFKFGKGSDKKTTTQQPTTVTTTEENTNTTDNTDDSSTTEDTTEATTASTEATKKKMIYVVGLSESAAKSQLEKAGFTNVRVDKVNDDEVPENYVIKQNISEAEEIEINKEIVITVSLGAAEISVPDVA
jgi:serine/threonine-protein kinase